MIRLRRTLRAISTTRERVYPLQCANFNVRYGDEHALGCERVGRTCTSTWSLNCDLKEPWVDRHAMCTCISRGSLCDLLDTKSGTCDFLYKIGVLRTSANVVMSCIGHSCARFCSLSRDTHICTLSVHDYQLCTWHAWRNCNLLKRSAMARNLHRGSNAFSSKHIVNERGSTISEHSLQYAQLTSVPNMATFLFLSADLWSLPACRLDC